MNRTDVYFRERELQRLYRSIPKPTYEGDDAHFEDDCDKYRKETRKIIILLDELRRFAAHLDGSYGHIMKDGWGLPFEVEDVSTDDTCYYRGRGINKRGTYCGRGADEHRSCDFNLHDWLHGGRPVMYQKLVRDFKIEVGEMI